MQFPWQGPPRHLNCNAQAPAGILYSADQRNRAAIRATTKENQ